MMPRYIYTVSGDDCWCWSGRLMHRLYRQNVMSDRSWLLAIV